MVELNGQDIVFKLDEHLTSVSAITDGFETFDAELSEALESMEAIDRELSADIDDLREQTDALMKSVNVDFLAFKASSIAAQNTLQAAFDEGVSALQTSTETTATAMRTDYNAKFGQMNDALDAIEADVDSKVSALEAATNTKFQTYVDDYNKQIAGVNTQTDASVTKLNKLTSDLSKKGDEKAILWIGGMRGHMYSGWRTMEFNRVELDASSNYFDIHNSYFQVKIPGIYRICFWAICHSNHNIRYMIRINGNNLHGENHFEGGDRYGGRRHWWRTHWEDVHLDHTWHFKANERVEIRMYSHDYALHGGSNRQAPNRVTFTYLGPNSVGLRM